MAESRPLPKTRARSAPKDRPQSRRGRLASRLAPPAIGAPRSRRQHIKDRALAVESDLSDSMGVGGQELDAITDLLGDALDDLLAGS
jgi:hypothetical protein